MNKRSNVRVKKKPYNYTLHTHTHTHYAFMSEITIYAILKFSEGGEVKELKKKLKHIKFEWIPVD